MRNKIIIFLILSIEACISFSQNKYIFIDNLFIDSTCFEIKITDKDKTQVIDYRIHSIGEIDSILSLVVPHEKVYKETYFGGPVFYYVFKCNDIWFYICPNFDSNFFVGNFWEEDEADCLLRAKNLFPQSIHVRGPNNISYWCIELLVLEDRVIILPQKK